MNSFLLSASILAAPHHSQEEIQKAITIAEKSGCDLIHIDVMDGSFVQQQTIWNDPEEIKKIYSHLPLDIHVMIENPDDRYLEFIHAGASMFSFHIEAAKDPEVLLSKLHDWDVKTGVVINPETTIEKILPYLSLIDYVLIMSVHPGKAGQKFIPATLEKVHFIKEHYPHVLIQIDGGMNIDTISLALKAGADIIVVGSGMYMQENPLESVEELRKLQKSI